MLHYETITPTLLNVLKKWMSLEVANDLNLVGGTALSLYFGHRLSEDIDLFSANPLSEDLLFYIENAENIEIRLKGKYHNQLWDNKIKVDITFLIFDFSPPQIIDKVRIADPLDIFAMKLDAITTRKVKKDFYDIAELINQFSFETGYEIFNKKYPYSKNQQLIFEAIGGIDDADESIDPIILRGENWENTKNFIKKEAVKYFRVRF